MKSMKAALVLTAILCGIAVSGPALADRHGHGRAHIGIVIGAPLFWPWYYPAPYYYPAYPAPVVTVPSAPTTYIEQGSPPAPSQGSWYYCAGARAYYPYVKTCPGGWQQVAPQPPPG